MTCTEFTDQATEKARRVGVRGLALGGQVKDLVLKRENAHDLPGWAPGAPTQRPQGPGPAPLPRRGDARHYLEGLELALHLLGEVLAVLPKLALLGGLGHRILQLCLQLRRENSAAYCHPLGPLRLGPSRAGKFQGTKPPESFLILHAPSDSITS